MRYVLVGAVCVFVLAGSAMAEAKTDSFYATVDEAGSLTSGGGTGYDGGEWYYYPNTGWYNEWFYDDPPDPLRWKEIDLGFCLDPGLGGGLATIAINWSTLDFPESGPAGPPPVPPLSPEEEGLYIGRLVVYDGSFTEQVNFCDSFAIMSYNPEWVSIDIMGSNFDISGTICHECVPEPVTLVIMLLGVVGVLRRR